MASNSCLSTGLIGDTEGKPGPNWNGGDVGDAFSEINLHEGNEVVLSSACANVLVTCSHFKHSL